MRYLLMIHRDEIADGRRTPAESQSVMQAYGAFTKDLKDHNVYVAGEALQPASTATTVRVRNGKTVTTDGPFAETKEQLGGYYLIDCANLDEAIGWAVKIPHAAEGSIEIRPVRVFGNTTAA